jgi:hypothetical protein
MLARFRKPKATCSLSYVGYYRLNTNTSNVKNRSRKGELTNRGGGCKKKEVKKLNTLSIQG